MQPNRLSKILSRAGVASRRGAETLIFSGKVRVNEQVVTLPQTIVDPEKDQIQVDSQLLLIDTKRVYYMLNKPRGLICSNQPMSRKKLVIDLFAKEGRRLFTIGRLDRDTTGLLLVTNDGHFAQNVIHPSKNIAREYLVKTEQELTHEHLVALSKGTLIEKVWVRPSKVTKVRKGTVKIVVKEGKKREVRLLVQNAGLTLVSLTRIRIGGLKLGALKEGEWRPLSEKDRASIFT